MEMLELYQRLFRQPGYALHDMSLPRYLYALTALDDTEWSSVIDVGCGRGVLAREIAKRWPDRVVEVADIDKFHSLDAPHYMIDLCDARDRELFSERAHDVVLCLDVLEHMPEDAVPEIIASLAGHAGLAIVTVAHNAEDTDFGDIHLTQRSVEWWADAFAWNFTVKDSCSAHEGTATLFTLVPLS